MTPAVAREMIGWAVTLAAAVMLVRQCRKPAGWPGRVFLSVMNRTHAGVTAWGLARVHVEPQFTILDVGCGGGRTVSRLAASASAGQVYGIDYSAASVAAARRTNAASIASNHVDIRQGTVSRLPFADATFDLVTAVETHYYWPDLASDLREILRVLKPGGRLLIIAEMYKRGRFSPELLPMVLLGARYLTAAEHHDALAGSGYTEIAIEEDRARGWICAAGRKPEAATS